MQFDSQIAETFHLLRTKGSRHMAMDLAIKFLKSEFNNVLRDKYHLLGPPQSHPLGHARDKCNTR